MDLDLTLETRSKLVLFDQIRRGESSAPFWDAVVLTAADADQAATFERILTDKQEAGHIPKSRFLVFADPPGPKIGNGGATLHALEQLRSRFSDEFLKWKVLLIHAGGFSTRLPNVSVIGKIFATLPTGNPLLQMLEVKMATYVEFPANMQPGVFVTCADDIEVFDGEGIAFDQRGFTALGHPSSLTIGTTHGVFVLDAESRTSYAKGVSKDKACVPGHCQKFLHKPSIQVMEQQGAVVAPDMVYTDSAFFFDSGISSKLLNFYDQHKPIQCEIDAYGDFLQALGSAASDEYITNVANVVSVDDSLTKTRRRVFECLKGEQLNVILCNKSKFYHIGTVAEYLHHLCTDVLFRKELGIVQAADVSPSSCVMRSSVHSSSAVSPGSVVEYSRVGPDCSVGPSCVISCCHVPAKTVVSDNLFFHTTCVGEDQFACLVFGCQESLKTKAKTREEAKESLTWCGVELGVALERLGWVTSALWPQDEDSAFSLWTANVVPISNATAEDVFDLACTLSHVVTGQAKRDQLPQALKMTSFQKVLANKNLDRVLHHMNSSDAADSLS